MGLEVTPLINRLEKMHRHYGKWARRQGISCYRVYDADIPEFPLAVDVYGDCLHVSEYQRKHHLTEEEHSLWRSACMGALMEVFGLPPDRIFLKVRKPQKGREQYEKLDTRRNERIVEEGGLKFIVNLSDYLDTGLFLDHRITRQWVREKAAGKRFLNLFAYTGSFTVYAAAGGATGSTTVDLSNTYLDWARRNLVLNGLAGPNHAYERADVLSWLEQPVREKYDLAVLDPPTFSNSKAMRDLLDTQRDHVFMINAVLARLNPGGLLYFSTNFRKFKLEEGALRANTIRDVSAASVPVDFQRNRKIHYCWEIGV